MTCCVMNSTSPKNVPCLSDDTPILPHVVADAVCRKAAFLAGSDLPLQYGDKLAERAETVYRHNEHFRKTMRKRTGRDSLYAFMQHWLCGYLKQDGATAVLRALPVGFEVGAA